MTVAYTIYFAAISDFASKLAAVLSRISLQNKTGTVEGPWSEFPVIFVLWGVDGSLLTILDDEALVAMSVEISLHRKRILNEIKWMMYEIEHPHPQERNYRALQIRNAAKKKAKEPRPKEKTESELFDELDFI